MSIAVVVVVAVFAASLYSLFVIVIARLCGIASRSTEGLPVGRPTSPGEAADRVWQ